MSIGQLCDAIPGQPFCEVRYATVDGGTPFVFSTPFAQEAVEVRAHDVVDRDPNAVSFDLQPELDAIVGEKVHVLAVNALSGDGLRCLIGLAHEQSLERYRVGHESSLFSWTLSFLGPEKIS
jgi:hypothetical protein